MSVVDCLLIIDMQEDYVGNGRNRNRYPYHTAELIENINRRITQYPKEAVVYITNKFFWERAKTEKELVQGLFIVSDHIFEKRKSSCFSNQKLLNYLQKIGAKKLELVGVDGNYCVGCSALDGAKKGFAIVCNEACIGIGNAERFSKVKRKLEKVHVQFVY